MLCQQKGAFNPMKYKAIIFDLFGTLVGFYTQAFRRALSEMAGALNAPHQDFVRLWVETYEKRATGVFASVEANLSTSARLLGCKWRPLRFQQPPRYGVTTRSAHSAPHGQTPWRL